MINEQIVHIIDDDDAVRDALCMLMKSEGISTQAYSSAEDVLQKYTQLKCGCMLLDIRMPGMDGMQLLMELKRLKVCMPVIFITGHGDVELAVKAMRSGATDFIEKPFNNDYLLTRIRQCLKECIQFNCAKKLQQEIEAKISRLTKREHEVMLHLADGQQNKVIARELGISVRTVELHRARVMEKLQAHSLSDVVRLALRINNDPS